MVGVSLCVCACGLVGGMSRVRVKDGSARGKHAGGCRSRQGRRDVDEVAPRMKSG